MSPNERVVQHGSHSPGAYEARDDSAYRSYAQQPLDLDSDAPLLRSGDTQRLNRKAMVFLAGIVTLLLASAAWMFSAAGAGSPATARAVEKVVIPGLPQASTALGETAPIPVMSSPPSAAMPVDLPVLPAPAPQPMPAVAPLAPAAFVGAAPRELTLLERREGRQAPSVLSASAEPYAQALLAGMPPPPQSAAPAPSQPMRAEMSDARTLEHADALLVRGTYIRCILETRIVTDIPGFTSCVVTEPVYSINGRTLLLPKGSKVSGRYDTDANGPRVAVAWDRITTPTGLDVRMESPGVDNLGGAGHPGDYDAHWPARIGAALMISLISDVFKYEGETHGPRTTTVSNGLVTQAPFESNTARTMERLANQALDRSVSRPATVTINQGTVVNIYVAKDVDFTAVLPR